MPILFLLVLLNLSFTAMVGTRVAFALHALDLGASPFAVGLLATANQAVPFALSYALGVMADRFAARWLLAKEGASFLDLLREPGLLRVVAVSGVVQLAMDLYPFYMPVYGHALGLSASVIGVVMACGYVSSFGVRAVLPRLVKHFGEERMLAASLGLTALAFALFVLTAQAATLAAVALLFGLAIGAAAPLTTIFMYKRSPKGREGQAMGLRLMGNSAVRTCGPATFGAIAGLVGLPGVFLATSGVLGAAGWTLWRRSAERG